MLTGGYVDPSAGKVTFKSYAEEWRERQPHRPLTAYAVESILRTHAYPTFGDRPLAAIRPSEVQAWVTGRCQVVAISTMRNALKTVRAVFRAAVLDRVVTFSPCDGVKVPRAPREQVHPMTAEQVMAMADQMPERYRALVTVGAATGLRIGELVGLSVDRVDWLRRTIRADRQIVDVPRVGPVLASPKTEASVRTIPAPAAALEALSAHLAAFPAGQDKLIFTTAAGGPIAPNRVRLMWRPAAKRPVWSGAHRTTSDILRPLC